MGCQPSYHFYLQENGGRVEAKVPIQGFILIDPKSPEGGRLTGWQWQSTQSSAASNYSHRLLGNLRATVTELCAVYICRCLLGGTQTDTPSVPQERHSAEVSHPSIHHGGKCNRNTPESDLGLQPAFVS